jgi:hypothetical protein
VLRVTQVIREIREIQAVEKLPMAVPLLAEDSEIQQSIPRVLSAEWK